MMQGMIERSYGRIMKTALRAINPLKKIVVKTECKVHIFLINQGLVILKNDGYGDEHDMLVIYQDDLNAGVVWADQDLKSRNHFYNPVKDKGLYGASNALKECSSYYAAALTWWKKGDRGKSLFFLGAACHLVQDVTVPQHVNVRLLKQHRKYEQWVINTFMLHDRFKCYEGGVYLSRVNDFIAANAELSLDTYDKYKNVKDNEEKFFKITDSILCQAERTTAGMLKMFYDDLHEMDKTY